jgi:hypothetical protein
METKNETPKKEAGIISKFDATKGRFCAFEHADGSIHAWLHDIVSIEVQDFILDSGTKGKHYLFKGADGQFHQLSVFEHKED